MKIMISQPKNGKTEEQIRKERAELVKELEEQGHEVLNTVFSDEYLTKDRPKACNAGIWALSKSLEVLGQADAVVFIKGWEQSRGCRIENQVALAYGKFIKLL